MSTKVDHYEDGLNGLLTTSSNISGIAAYYNFDGLGYMQYSGTTVPRLYLFTAVQSSHPAGGSYWTPWSYWIAAKHQYSGGWKGQWSEERTGPFAAAGIAGKYRQSGSYYDELAESWSDDTTYMAVLLQSGGSGTVIGGWNGYVVQYFCGP